MRTVAVAADAEEEAVAADTLGDDFDPREGVADAGRGGLLAPRDLRVGMEGPSKLDDARSQLLPFVGREASSLAHRPGRRPS